MVPEDFSRGEMDTREGSVPRDSLIKEGDLLEAGRYRVRNRLGQGGMGQLWLAGDTTLKGRMVVLKLLADHLPDNERFRQRLKNEIDALIECKHENIVGVTHRFQLRGQTVFVMDYISGSDLQTLIDDKGKMYPDRVASIVKQICAALYFVHQKKIIHRDVKPANIMLDDTSGKAYLVDFGLALRTVQKSRLTQTGAMVGTPAYSSPEQINGAAVTAATDQYSLAATVYAMLTGQSAKVVVLDGAELHGVELILRKALSDGPRDRYANIIEFGRALVEALRKKRPGKLLKKNQTAAYVFDRQQKKITSHRSNASDEEFIACVQKSGPDNVLILELGDNASITDSSIAFAAEHMSRLETVNVEGCRKITTAGLNQLSKCENIAKINARNCPLVCQDECDELLTDILQTN